MATIRYAGGGETGRIAMRRQTPDYVSLYRCAFAEYVAPALWNIRLFEDPSPAGALVVARALRYNGNLEARRLAERIEQVCRATV